jgi:hypothetical protein
MPFSVPTRGKITTNTSFAAATDSEVQIAGLIPGRDKTSLALTDPAASRSCWVLTSFIDLKRKKGTSDKRARSAANIKAEVEDRGKTPADPAMTPPSAGPTLWPSDVAKEKYPKF